MAVVGVGVYRHALEEASSVLADGDEFLSLGKLGQLQDLRLGERRHGKAGTLGRSQEGIHDLSVLLSKNRAGGIDKLTAGSHARGGFLEHRQLQFRKLNRHVLFGQAPRNLRMPAHGAGTRARGIDKHRIEQIYQASHRTTSVPRRARTHHPRRYERP